MKSQEELIVSETESEEIDLLELFQVLRHQLAKIILVALAVALLSGLITAFAITPKYSATSKLYILSNTQSVISVSDLQIGAALTYDYEEMLKSRPVLEKVIENLNLDQLDITTASLLKMMSITNPDDTRMINITVTYKDPAICMQIANELANVSKKQIASIMKIDEPEIVEEAIEPEVPSSPSMKKNVLFGALAGGLFMALIVVIRYLTDNTVATAEDVEKYLGMNTLAVIPDTESAEAGRKKHRKKSEKEDSEQTE